MKKFLLSLFTLPLFTLNTEAQCLSGGCFVDITASATTICQGQSTTLIADSGSALLFNTFNSSTLGAGWVTNNNVVNFNSPCGPSLDGTPHVWFGNAAGAGTRLLQTVDFNVMGGGTISFDLRFAIQGQASPCEGPDEADEGVSLQYSTDGGVTWGDIIYFSPSGNLLPSNPGGNGAVAPALSAFNTWANYSFAIPPAAITPCTRFRWFQPFNTSATNDHWGIDNVSIVSAAPPSGPSNFVWLDNGQPVTGPRVVSPTVTTSYIAQWANPTDTCRDTITIIVNPIPAAPSFTVPPVCQGQQFSLAPNPLLPGATYYWTGSNGVASNAMPYQNIGSSAWNNVTMNLVVVANGCTSTAASNVIQVTPTPVLSITGLNQECEGVPVQLTANPAGLDSFLWSSGATGQVVSVLPGQSYTVTGYQNGCPGTSQPFNVAIVPNPLTVAGNQPFCENRTITLTATGGKQTYTWNGTTGADSTYVVSSDDAPHVILTVVSPNGCSRTDTIDLTIYPVPNAFFTPGSICDGENIQFDNVTTLDSSGGAAIAGYFWNFGDGTNSTDTEPSKLFNTHGTYNISLVAVSSQGCADTATVPFKVYKKPEANFVFAPYCFGAVMFSDSTALGDTTVSAWLWTFDNGAENETVATFEKEFDGNSVNVTLQVTDYNGCIDDTTINVPVMATPDFTELPNVITPNGDLMNDEIKLLPIFDECYDYSVQFFNRWGQKVFEINNSSQAFNGVSSAGTKLEDGVYFYVLVANGEKRYSGSVTIFTGS
ncbi:MAG: gliding motility-associated C-terminal domain-containing protein [Bacteroidia bacterium]|nr:gliding motility-associated C-terminal domain-containing protein [Bacteroidia bacterium]